VSYGEQARVQSGVGMSPARRCSLPLCRCVTAALRLVWRIVLRDSSLKASLNQSCGGVALRRAEAGGGLRGYARQAKGPPRGTTLRARTPF
jgi:hypothetical protein